MYQHYQGAVDAARRNLRWSNVFVPDEALPETRAMYLELHRARVRKDEARVELMQSQGQMDRYDPSSVTNDIDKIVRAHTYMSHRVTTQTDPLNPATGQTTWAEYGEAMDDLHEKHFNNQMHVLNRDQQVVEQEATYERVRREEENAFWIALREARRENGLTGDLFSENLAKSRRRQAERIARAHAKRKRDDV